MEKECGHMTDRILNLTLEIIYLLTGENYIAFKLTDGFVTPKLRKVLHPAEDPPSPPDNDKKIQDVTQKMIELLTGEVPIRCQDANVSKEEEGCAELHKEVTMDNPPPLTSSDGPSDQHTPSPLYSRDSTEEHQEVPQDYQAEDLFGIKVKNISEEESYVSPDEPSKEVQVPPEMSTDGPNNSSTPERCPSPLYSRESTRKHRKIGPGYPRKDVVVIKVEDSDDEEQPYVRGDKPCNEKQVPEISTDSQKDFKDEEKREMKSEEDEFPPELSTDGRYIRNNLEKCPVSYPDVELEDDDLTTDSADDIAVAPSFHPIMNTSDLSSDPSTHGGCFTDFPRPVIDPAATWSEVMAPCFDLNECFSQRAKLRARQKIQKGSETVSCSECGKSFAHKSNLITHERIHNSDRRYPCSICGKRFTQKSHMVTHKRIHTGEKPHSCSTCGKSFTDKSNLVAHQRIHTGLKPYSCPECGKSFTRRAYFLDHQRENKCERAWYFK